MPPRRRTDEERKSAIDSLFRVRAVETPADTSGEKEVWHQGSKGADLFTVVNRTGHVVRQEFVLFEDYFAWTKQGGLRTGVSGTAKGIKDVIKASDEIKLDGLVDEDRVERARSALHGYTGKDPYLLHVRTVINLAAIGEQAGELSAVTMAQGLTAANQLRAAAAASAQKKQDAAHPMWPYLAAGSALGFIVVAIVWLIVK